MFTGLLLYTLAAVVHALPAAEGRAQSAPARQTEPELVFRTGHTYLLAMAFSPDRRMLVTSGERVMLWEVSTGRLLRSFPARTARHVAFARGSQWVTIRDGSLFRVWDVVTGRELGAGPAGDRQIFALHADRGLLAIGGADNTVRLHDAISGKDLHVLKPRGARLGDVRFAADGRSLVTHAGTDGDPAETIQIWDVTSGLQISESRGTHVEPAASSPDATQQVFVVDRRTLEVRDAATSRTIRVLGPVLQAGAEWSRVIYSPNGRWIAAATGGATAEEPTEPRRPAQRVIVWEAASGREIAAAALDRPAYGALAFSPDSRWLAADGTLADPIVDGGVLLWDATRGWRATAASGFARRAPFAFSADGKWLATREDVKGVRIEELAAGSEVRSLDVFVPFAGTLAMSPDGRWIAATDGRERAPGVHLKLWDVRGGGIRALNGSAGRVHHVAFTSSAQLMTVTAQSATVWEPATGRRLRTFAYGDEPIESASVCFRGALLAVTRRATAQSESMTIETWDAATGRRRHGWVVRNAEVATVRLSPDCERLAAAGRMWDVKGLELSVLPDEATSVDDFSPDGQSFFIGSTLYSIDSARAIRRLDTGGYGFRPTPVFSPDGRWVAAPLHEQVKVWDTANGWSARLLDTLPEDSLAFSPGGGRLLIASGGTIQVWDPQRGALAGTLVFTADAEDWVVAAPNGLFDGSPEGWSRVLWRFGGDTFDVAPVESFFSEFYQPGLLSGLFTGNMPVPSPIAAIDRRAPRVRLEADASGASPAEGRTIRATLTITQPPADSARTRRGGVRDVRLFRNGSLVKAWRGDLVEPSDRPLTLDATVTLAAGANRLVAYAFNRDNVKGEDATLVVNGPKTAPRRGVAYVVAVGIDRYANPAFDLKYAAADAQAFSAALADAQRSLDTFERVELIPILNADATRATILDAIGRLAGAGARPGAPAALDRLSAAGPEDLVALFFAGHGMARGERFYLIPHDLGYAGPRRAFDDSAASAIAARSVSDQDLERALEGVDAGHLVLVIDACQSGQALEATDRLGPLNARGLAQLAYEKGIDVLTASQSYQAAVEVDRLGHGLLSYALIEEGLKKGLADRAPADGTVSLREWLEFAADRVPQVQWDVLRQDRSLKLAFVEGETAAPDARQVQRPRVYYKADITRRALRIARPRATVMPSSWAGLSREQIAAAAEAGNPDAQAVVGMTLLAGGPDDLSAAADWFQRAADQGHPLAQVQLAALYSVGAGVPFDPRWAVRLLTPVAESGFGLAQAMLGLAYLEGAGVGPNAALGVDWCRKGAAQGVSTAHICLGAAFLEGLGVPKDEAEATRQFRVAAEDGNPEAQYLLAGQLLAGSGVVKDEQQARAWLEKAAAQGHQAAIAQLARMKSPANEGPP